MFLFIKLLHAQTLIQYVQMYKVIAKKSVQNWTDLLS